MIPNPKTLIALLLLSATAAIATAPAALADDSRATPARFAGTFYATADRIVTYNADGTVQVILADMFTEDLATPSVGRKTTPLLGVWRKIGDNTIQVSTLGFATEQLGHNYAPNGYIYKTKWVAIYDEPVNGVSPGYTAINIVVEGFLPGQNPITDPPAFVLPLPDGTADRLYVD